MRSHDVKIGMESLKTNSSAMRADVSPARRYS